jgi:hypothetical protein
MRRKLYPELKVIILLDLAVCSHVHVHRLFEEMIESYRSTRRCIPEDIILNSRRYEEQISNTDPEIFRILYTDRRKDNSSGTQLKRGMVTPIRV